MHMVWYMSGSKLANVPVKMRTPITSATIERTTRAKLLIITMNLMRSFSRAMVGERS